MKKKKTQSKKRRVSHEKTAKRQPYFTADTQANIVAYQQSEDAEKKKEIFLIGIYPAFDKLVENLINIHGFMGQYDTRDDLKNDCIAFLYESIHKFKPEMGTKAFSYFNIVAKHWLIIKSKKRAQQLRRNVSISDTENLSKLDVEMIELSECVPSQDECMIKIERSQSIIDLLIEIRNRLKTDNELACISAIITLFEMSGELDLLNKSAVLMYIREMSSLTSKQLTMSMYVIKRHYRELHGDDRFRLFY